MPSKLFLPNRALEELRCMQCKNYLSIFPIYLPENEKGAICGRCVVLQTENFVRDDAYENIAIFLTFPCQFQESGCDLQLNPQKLKEHESGCKFRTFECPSKVYTKCTWTGPSKDMLNHIETLHPALLIKENQFEINFYKNQKENLLLEFKSNIFIVTKEICFKEQLFRCAVHNIMVDDSSNNLVYVLRLEGGDHKQSFRTEQKRTTSLTGENQTRVTLDTILESLENPSKILVNIDIKQSTFTTSETKETKESVYPEVNFDMLNELECPICYEYMLPPIFQCVNGHSICCDCKPKVSQCPVCKKQVDNTQNFTLEKMTSYLVYPCKWHKNGCQFAVKSNLIRDHEKTCAFGIFDCPLKEQGCIWTSSISKMEDHIFGNHKSNVLENDVVDLKWKNDAYICCRIIKFSSLLFRLLHKYEDDIFYWSVQCMSSDEQAKKIKFEVDIIDKSGNNLRFFFRNQCCALSDLEDAFYSPNTFSTMHLDQVKIFMNDYFGFKVRIFKD